MESFDSMKTKILLFMILGFPVVLPVEEINKYCLLESCPDGSHTMCEYTETRAARACGRVIRAGFEEQEISRIVNVHNNFRLTVYTGNEFRGVPEGPQPKGIDFEIFEWHEDLALIAQRWANQCMIVNDACRDTEDYYVGQNIIVEDYVEGISQEIELTNLQWLITKWYNEVKYFDVNQVTSFNKHLAVHTNTHHYSQIVWGITKYIGCGVVRFSTLQGKSIFFVCNYAPAGNNDMLKMYNIQKDEDEDEDEDDFSE